MVRSTRTSIPPTRLTYTFETKKEVALRVLRKALGREKLLKGTKSKCVSLPVSPKKLQKLKKDGFIFKPQRFGLTEDRMKQIQKARSDIVKAEKFGDEAIREAVAKTRQEIIAGNETASMQRNRTGRTVRHSNKVYVSHILANTFNYNKLKPNEPICRIKGQIYFDKVEADNLRWKDIVNLKKRKLLTGKRHLRRRKNFKETSSSEDSSINGKAESLQQSEKDSHDIICKTDPTPRSPNDPQENSDEEEL